jgi:hypothetical protein
MLCPSRGRPGNAAALAALWPDVTESARLHLIADADDPELAGYEAIPLPAHVSLDIIDGPRRLGPILNSAGPPHAAAADAVGFLGDDHRPRTAGWDTALLAALDGRAGVAYGDDLFQHERVPTACVISASLIRALGYMVPPGLAHLYLDDFWARLGMDAGNLSYCPDVVIEHLHPAAGKGIWDAGYTLANSAETWTADGAAWEQFLADRWPADLAAMRKRLAGG